LISVHEISLLTLVGSVLPQVEQLANTNFIIPLPVIQHAVHYLILYNYFIYTRSLKRGWPWVRFQHEKEALHLKM